MSTQAEPAEGLDPEIERYAQKLQFPLKKLVEIERELLKCSALDMTAHDIAKELGLKDLVSIPNRIHRLRSGFLFPESFTKQRKNQTFLRGLDILEEVQQPLPAPLPTSLSPSSSQPKSPSASLLAPTPKRDLQTIISEVPAGVRVLGVMVEGPIDRFRRFEGQPRTEFDQGDLKWLAGSIKHAGQLIPALLRRVTDDPRVDYEIVDGERRWISSRMAGKEFFKGIEYPGLSLVDAKKQYEIAVIANFGRSQHTDLELAYAAHKLMTDNGWTPAQVAAAMGRSVSTITQHLRLLKLHPEAQALMNVKVDEKKRLGMSHALKLVDYDPAFQQIVAHEMAEQEINGKRAAWFIRQRAADLGAIPDRTRRGRRPAGDARNIERFLERTDSQLDQYLHLPGELSLRDIFERRGAEDRAKTLARIEALAWKIQELKSNIRSGDISGK